MLADHCNKHRLPRPTYTDKTARPSKSQVSVATPMATGAGGGGGGGKKKSSKSKFTMVAHSSDAGVWASEAALGSNGGGGGNGLREAVASAFEELSYPNLQAAQHAASTRALFRLCPDLPLYRSMPPVYR